MPNPWLAIDVSTSPTARARDARRAWERFLEDPSTASKVRRPIADSWRRSAAVGIDPSRWLAPIELDEEQADERLAEHPLGRLAAELQDTLAAISDDAEHLVVVSDGDGLLLSVEGNHRVREQAASEINFARGSRWSEEAAGTNAIGTALAADHAVQVFASEHFSERVQWWTCSAAPIHDPASGQVVGIIDLTARMETVHPHSLALVMAAAATLETRLRAGLRERDNALLRRHADGAARERHPDSALVSADGRVLLSGRAGWSPVTADLPPGGGELVLSDGLDVVAEPLRGGEAFLLSKRAERPRPHPRAALSFEALGRDRARVGIDGGRQFVLSQRHSEILALLIARAAGMTGEQLAIALYGDAGKPVTARAEVSRLRRLLGRCVRTEPYRIAGATVQSDLASVQRLLRDGHVADAMALYRGPLLPRSEAPGVAEIRDELDGWVRRAVIASDNVDALWTWLNTTSGEDDVQAWKRFLTTIPHEDGRRSLAAERLERLRHLFGGARKPADQRLVPSG